MCTNFLGKEVGASGTPHLQCYIAYKNRTTFGNVKKHWPGFHIEVKVKTSTPQQASDYCKKDGDFIELGELPLAQNVNGGIAAKDKWDTVKTLALAGEMDDIDAEVFIKHYNTLKKIASDARNRILPDDLNWVETPNVWVHGPTGTGKSRWAREQHRDLYLKMHNKWWEGYAGQANILIDDVGTSHLWMGDFLKTWGDRYAFRAEIKQDSLVLRPKKIIVTSNYTPQELWPDKSIHEPILRRFRILEFGNKPALLRTQPTVYGTETLHQLQNRWESEEAVNVDEYDSDMSCTEI